MDSLLERGAGTLILEEYEHSMERGANISAEVVGFGTNSDGSHVTQPNKTTMARAMELSLSDTGLEPSDIQYINGHGTATDSGDIAERARQQQMFLAMACHSQL